MKFGIKEYAYKGGSFFYLTINGIQFGNFHMTHSLAISALANLKREQVNTSGTKE